MTVFSRRCVFLSVRDSPFNFALLIASQALLYLCIECCLIELYRTTYSVRR